MKRNPTLRIMDANFNRSREGLRVCEEIARFWLEDKNLTQQLKRARHALRALLEKMPISISDLMAARDSLGDVGKKPSVLEKTRTDVLDVFAANSERAKEALRALEETSKLVDDNLAAKFKKVRFRVYDIEKRALPKLEALRHR